MSQYRYYRLKAGKIASANYVEAEDDASAIEAVRRKNHATECEIWQRTRLVGTVQASVTPIFRK